MADDIDTGEAIGTETAQAPPGTEITPSGGILTRTDGSTTPLPPTDWRASLPVELQHEPVLAKYKSLDEALKGAVHAQKLVGKGFEPPAADAKPETVAEFRKRAGVPDTPEKYGITLPTPPEGQTWDQGQVNAFLTRMHAAHARPEVVQSALDTFVEIMAQRGDEARTSEQRETQAERVAAIKALEATWGPQGGPMWRHNQNRVLTAIHGLWETPAGIERAKQYADRDPEMARALEEIADQFTPTGFLGEAEQGTVGFGVTDALAKADAMRDAAIKDPKHPLNDPSHPEYERVTAEYLAYHARALGPRGRDVVAEVRR